MSIGTTAERIKKAMEIRRLRQTDIVSMTGINKGALSSYLSGRYEPKQNNIYLIARALDVSIPWLMGRDVPMGRFIIDETPEEDPTLLRRDHTLSEAYDILEGAGYKLDFSSKESELTIIYDRNGKFIAAVDDDDIMRYMDAHINSGTPISAQSMIEQLVFILSPFEQTLIMKYREADSGTQRAVRKLLDVADDYLMPIAAHAHDDATAEDLSSDIAMLREAAMEKK